jgi:alpha-glucosidase
MPPQPHGPPIDVVANDIGKTGGTTTYSWPRATHPVLNTLPVFIRGGSILPFEPLVQSTDETPSGPLELHVYPGPRCSGSLYLDDGHTLQYQHGKFLRQNITCESDANSMRLKFHAREGTYSPWWKIIEVVLYDWPSPSAQAKFSGSTYPLKTTYDPKQRALHVTLSDVTGEAELSIQGRRAP